VEEWCEEERKYRETQAVEREGLGVLFLFRKEVGPGVRDRERVS